MLAGFRPEGGGLEEDIVRRVNLGSGIRKEEMWEGGGVGRSIPFSSRSRRSSGQALGAAGLVSRVGWGSVG